MDGHGFPRISYARRLFRNLYDLLEDLTPISGPTTVTATGDLLPDNEALHGIPWIEDEQIIRELLVKGMSIPRDSLRSNPYVNNNSSGYGNRTRDTGDVDPIKFLAYMMEFKTGAQADPELILRLGDVCVKVENVVKQIHQVRETFFSIVSECSSGASPTLQVREAVEEAAIRSCLMDSEDDNFINREEHLIRPQHIIVVQFFSNPRSKYVLDTAIRLHLNLLTIAVEAWSTLSAEYNSRNSPNPLQLVDLPHVLRCVSHLAWIRWGWHTKDKTPRDLYLALDCLEEAIIHDTHNYSDIPPLDFTRTRKLANHILRLSQYYRIAHRLSGCIWELRAALTWGREGLELLLELEKPYNTIGGAITGRDSLRFQILCAQYDLSRLFDRLWSKTLNIDDGAAALEMACQSIQHLDSDSHRRTLQLFGDIERKLRRNYSYCRSKYIHGAKTIKYSDFSPDKVPLALGGALSYSPRLLRHGQDKSLDEFWASSDKWDARDLDSLIALRERTLDSIVVRPNVDREGCEALAEIMAMKLRREPYFTYFNVDQARQVFNRCSKQSQIGLFAALYQRTRDKRDREAAVTAFLKCDQELPGMIPLTRFKAIIEVIPVAAARSLDICHTPHLIDYNIEAVLFDHYLNETFLFFMEYYLGADDDLRAAATPYLLELGYVLLFTLLEAGRVTVAEYVFNMMNSLWPSCNTSDLPEEFSDILKQKFRPAITKVWFTHNTRENLKSELAELAESSMGACWKAGMTLVRLLVSDWIPEEWHHERLNSLRFLLSLIPYNFNFSSRFDERTMYKDYHHGLNFVDFLTRQSASIIEYGGTPSESLEFLEMSRGTILNNVIAYRGELDYLFFSHPQYARELRYLMEKLDEGFADSEPAPTLHCTEKEFTTYLVRTGQRGHDAHRLAVLQETIRKLPGYEAFMTNEYLGEVFARRAAEEGPIIFVSVWKRGHAIIVTKDSVQFLWLDKLNQEDAGRHLAVVANPDFSLGLSDSQKSLQNALRWLWDVVVEPIFHALGMLNFQKGPVTSSSVLGLPRIWWIGVGVMTHAPFHAAGSYPHAPPRRAKARYTARYCVSSYTPTIKALMHARGVSSSQRDETRPYQPQNVKLHVHQDTPGPSTRREKTQVIHKKTQDLEKELAATHTNDSNDISIKALLVGMPTTPNDEQPKAAPIKVRGSVLGTLDVEPEITKIKDIFEEMGGEVRELYSPEAGDVAWMVSSYNIIHFACHGEVNQDDPLRSRLVFQRSSASTNIGKGTGLDTNSNFIRDYLTVGDVLRLRRSDSNRDSNAFNLVYLSACSSASNRCADMRDEPLHVASVFQLAGFNHAIGTLWDSEDAVCIEVAHKFYEYLTQFIKANEKGKGRMNGRMGGCAEALHLAVDHVRNKYWNAPYKWAPFMHWGA